MKIQISNSDSEVATTLSGVRVAKHTMSSGSINLQMLMLRTGLYSNKIKSVVREYLTNARDAHLQAGQSKPIDVNIPNRFSNDFSIRDYGAGMSPDFIENVYVQYTASTKRDSDEMTGGWGIGSKSGYAYTNSFTVTSIFEGVKYTWLAQSFPDGSGDFSLVSSVPTAEHSGVKISITMIDDSDSYKFHSAVKMFSAFIDVPVSVNGEPIQKIESQSIYSCEEFKISFVNVENRNRYDKKIYLVQGGVPYPVSLTDIYSCFSEDSIILSKIKSYSCDLMLCIFVQNGTFMPDISREKIQFDSSGEALSKISGYLSVAENSLVDKFESFISGFKISNYKKFTISNSIDRLELSEADSKGLTPFILSMFKLKTSAFIRKASSGKLKTFENNSDFEYRTVQFNYEQIRTSSLDHPDYTACRIIAESSSVDILFCKSAYKRNQKIDKCINDFSLSKNRKIIVQSKTVSFEDYKKKIIDSLSDNDFHLSGLDPSKIKFYDISDLMLSTSSPRRKGQRRKTKFLKLDSVTYSGSLSFSKIPENEIETDSKIVFACIYRNKIVNEVGQEIQGGINREVMVNALNNNKISFRLIKLSEFVKNDTLTRGKIDFSNMTSISKLISLQKEYNTSFAVLNSFEKTVSEADSDCPDTVLSAIQSCRDTIDTDSVLKNLKSEGLEESDMIQTSCNSENIPSLLFQMPENKTYESLVKLFSKSFYYSPSEWTSNETIVSVSKILPDMFN